jgi:kynurenine formamidase
MSKAPEGTQAGEAQADGEQVVVPFDELPVLPGSGLRHSWQVYPSGDQLGTLNRLTGAAVAGAAATVQTGERVGLSLPLELPDPPLFDREQVRHTVLAAGRNTWDDRLDNLYPQASSQWDSLRHVRAREDGFYGGWQGNPDTDSERLGIQHWARRGIVGRGVLIDLAAGGGFDPFDHHVFEVADLQRALEFQHTTLRWGDILCIRTGWVDRYLALDEAGRGELAHRFEQPAQRSWAGLSGGEEMSRFLWDSGVAAVTCDNPAVEGAPGDPAVGSLHRRLIPCLGFALGELLDFTGLWPACQQARRYEFLFASVPLNLTGGVGSPASAVAVL